ncbi:MAG: phenylacetic acid degradation protein [Betaproteobacteria bacterium]|nr:phenylacetic acid degradation protein [Betaproteobacteria bacterium]
MKPPKPQWRSFPPFYDHLGLQLESIADGKCVIRLPYVKHFGNTRGEVHGGIVASLLDITLSQALRSTFHTPADVATISMTVSYLAPAVGELVCNGEVVRAGRSVAFAEGMVIDQEGNSVCRAVATYRILRPR